jgi:hypothetical protein
VKARNRSALKIRTNGKSYSLDSSPFYKLTSKKKLADLLKQPVHLLATLSHPENYKVFEINSISGKARKIQQPLNELERLHSRVASLLSRIKIPVNIHSGIKQKSHISNAREHVSSSRLITTDIKSFFPSTTKEMVYRLFRHDFFMSHNNADLLSKICCYGDHIPTGSRLSMVLAYWANYRMFAEIQALSNKHGVVFTLYVDDLTFSGDNANPLFLNTLKKIVQRHGHAINDLKTKFYSKDQVKIVTGVAIDRDTLKVKNSQHQKIYGDMQLWLCIRNNIGELEDSLKQKIQQRLIGRLSAASQVQESFRDKARSIMNYQNV